ncbi:MAG TPA: SusC/RagA family TonB-linked outer membrane protein [Panacibacter sp.]|nr:SusC/RagA family TonB-linked outer membrane protein [Panacibacter sp.]HNP43845.1 SusC/RagA family TonB-linked outer membrane protein [Panacibacter sp.]
MTTTRLLRVLLFCPLFMLIMQQSWAQNKNVSGKVSDDKGNPVAGASVLVKGSKSGTSTDASGSFTLSVPASATTLVISYVGFASQDVSIANSSSVTVTLQPENTSLNDVVVIGYSSVRKKDVTGSVTSLKEKDFNKGTITSPDQLLQNKVPGLEVTNNSGQPGAATTVKIRGNNSIRGGNNPIYVVDGVILDGRSARPSVNLTGLGATPDANPLLFINPNDIASIDVLKDASATAIYGSRGANGVIVITTKKGTSGASKLEFNAGFGFNAGFMKKYEILDAGQYRSALSKYNVPNASTLDGGKTVDAQKEITQNKLSQNYSLAFSGGNETGKFRGSFLGSGTQGFIKNTSLDRYLGNFGGTYKFLDKKLTLDFDLIAGHTTENLGAVTNNAGSQGNLISSTLQWNPTTDFKDGSGYYIFPTNGSGNPLALIDGISDIANVNTFLGNISAAYKILPNLEYKFLYAINHSAGYRNTNEYGWLQGYSGLSGSGVGVISNAVLSSQTFTHTLNYNAKLTQDLRLDATAGFEYWKSDYSNNSFSATGFNTNLTQQTILDIPYTSILRNGSVQNPPNTYVDPTTELQSYFVRGILNFKDKYYITGTFRADGSSKFGENNKYGYFPSVAGKWVVSNESFMKGGLFSSLALRASWGKTGNQEFPAGAAQEQFGFTSFNNAQQINVANPDLKWETTTSYDLGVDFSFMKGKIYGGFDYYNKTTTDILFQSTAIQPAPASTYWINIPGDLKNTGFEFAIGATLIDKKDFSLDATFNIANNKNLLTNFYAPGTKTPLTILTGEISGQGVSGTLSQIITNDQPVNEYWLKPFNGFDENGNQKIGDNPAYAGDPNPHTIYGASVTLRYKKLSLAINGGGAGGYLIYNNTRTSVTNLAGILQGRNVDQAAYNSEEGAGSGVGASARFLESGNYFKLRNASLNYNVGNVGKIKGLNFYVTASNLLISTKFTGFDPEVNVDKASGGYPSRSIEYIPYPTPRTIILGLSFSL